MSNREPLRVSFEGERGSGKTTVISLLVADLEQFGYKTIVNRAIQTGKNLNPAHLGSRGFHQKWESLIKSGDKPNMTEAMAVAKFHHALTWFLEEEQKFMEAIKNMDFFICDRDIDTIVLYATVEVILSNPENYNNDAAKFALISSLWTMTCSVRDFPDRTFCLTSSAPDQTLLRSHNSKQGTREAYDLDMIQKDMQQLAAQLLVPVVSHRPDKLESLSWLNIDNKTPKELKDIILAELLQ